MLTNHYYLLFTTSGLDKLNANYNDTLYNCSQLVIGVTSPGNIQIRSVSSGKTSRDLQWAVPIIQQLGMNSELYITYFGNCRQSDFGWDFTFIHPIKQCNVCFRNVCDLS